MRSVILLILITFLPAKILADDFRCATALRSYGAHKLYDDVLEQATTPIRINRHSLEGDLVEILNEIKKAHQEVHAIPNLSALRKNAIMRTIRELSALIEDVEDYQAGFEHKKHREQEAIEIAAIWEAHMLLREEGQKQLADLPYLFLDARQTQSGARHGLKFKKHGYEGRLFLTPRLLHSGADYQLIWDAAEVLNLHGN